jgi:hypothetical protein
MYLVQVWISCTGRMSKFYVLGPDLDFIKTMYYFFHLKSTGVRVMVFNATFNNISVISGGQFY